MVVRATLPSSIMPKRQPVWDLPLRLFHWALAALVAGAMISGTIGGNALTWHMRAGYCILALLVFRILWGFWGSHHARFASFIRGPRAIVAYLRGESPPAAGHNPLGAISVVAMLFLLLAQAVLGLFANDDIFSEGPLYKLVSKETSDWLTSLHKRNVYLIATLVTAHVLAVAYHLIVKRDNLIKPMITGCKDSCGDEAQNGAHSGGRLGRAMLLFGASTALVWVLVTKV